MSVGPLLLLASGPSIWAETCKEVQLPLPPIL